jgi:transposase
MAIRNYQPDQELLFWPTPREILPQDHLCFVVDEVVECLDLSALPDRKESVGAPAYDPRLLIKVLFYGYATGTFSSRALKKAVQENVAYTYLTRGQCPDFRTIADFRKDHRVFLREAFVQIVKICQGMGIVQLGRVALDGTKIRANASNQQTYTQEELEEQRQRIERALRAGIQKDEEEDQRYGQAASGEELPKDLQSSERRLKRLEEVLAQLRARGEEKINLTDPDAHFLANQGRIETSYNCQTAVDEGQQVIVGVDVITTPADSHQVKPQVEQIEATTGQKPEKLLMDSGYHSVANVAYLEQSRIDGYMPDEDLARSQKVKFRDKEQSFDKRHFRYDHQEDIYICPAGQKLVRWREQRVRRLTLYRGIACEPCEHRDRCVRGAGASRTVCRFDQEAALQRMRQKMETETGRAELKKRRALVEPVFGHFKSNLRFRQFHCRGQPGALGEFLLLCIGHNLRKLASYFTGPSHLQERRFATA